MITSSWRMIVSPTVVEEEDGDTQGGGNHTFSDVCARVVKIFHMSIPKIPTSRGVETATTAEGNNLLGFITVIKINSSRRLKYRFGIRSVTFES